MRLILVVGLTMALQAGVQAASLDEAISVVRTASPTQATSNQVREAWKALVAASPDDIPTMLRGMNDSNPAVENWIRTAIDQVAEQTLDSGGELPRAELIDLLADTSAAPRARRTSYELLEQIDADKAHEMLASMVDDPSLEMRYDAIAAGIAAAESAEGDEAVAQYRKLFEAARNLEQIQTCKRALKEAGVEVDLAKHMGFVTAWRMIGVFDNRGQAGFDVAYPPEEQVDFAATYDGKEGEATWKTDLVTTDKELGQVDVNEAIGPEKGAVTYAYAEIDVDESQTAQVRYSSPNATKLWVNGNQVADNEVYHAGGEVDQYVADVTLKKGRNTLLLKVCQNEQKEAWAQDWNFQLRICEPLGGGLQFENVTNNE
ncbi:hypothetical protein NG895_25665 [Aeoliella sp. ICT_H6.2]|uniref:HEAT repeat protein n=1 Tax=Aeoliella straminimaris TaxID=2954799 RepID=A0A9X2FFL3_9BACT|nr:hypothetical protein [Aeoliella straminimaris]MCO6047303.1 hypothetical protein [Aeoliella straminimaris]